MSKAIKPEDKPCKRWAIEVVRVVYCPACRNMTPTLSIGGWMCRECFGKRIDVSLYESIYKP
jgi:hypothetical protein